MMDTRLLFKEIENLKKTYTDFLIDVVKTESPTADKSQVDKVGMLLLQTDEEVGSKGSVKEIIKYICKCSAAYIFVGLP